MEPCKRPGKTPSQPGNAVALSRIQMRAETHTHFSSDSSKSLQELVKFPPMQTGDVHTGPLWPKPTRCCRDPPQASLHSHPRLWEMMGLEEHSQARQSRWGVEIAPGHPAAKANQPFSENKRLYQSPSSPAGSGMGNPADVFLEKGWSPMGRASWCPHQAEERLSRGHKAPVVCSVGCSACLML